MRISDWSSAVCSSDLAATTEQEDINATIAITGSAQDSHIAFTSTPALPQDEVLNRLLFGSSPENLSATEAIPLAAALNPLRGGGRGLNPLGTLRPATAIGRTHACTPVTNTPLVCLLLLEKKKTTKQ